jgi:hypothetical protein
MVGEEEDPRVFLERDCPPRGKGAIPLCRLYAPAIESVSRLYGSSSHLSSGPIRWDETMLDLVFVVLGAALFLGALVYARGCAGI